MEQTFNSLIKNNSCFDIVNDLFESQNLNPPNLFFCTLDNSSNSDMIIPVGLDDNGILQMCKRVQQKSNKNFMYYNFYSFPLVFIKFLFLPRNIVLENNIYDLFNCEPLLIFDKCNVIYEGREIFYGFDISNINYNFLVFYSKKSGKIITDILELINKENSDGLMKYFIYYIPENYYSRIHNFRRSNLNINLQEYTGGDRNFIYNVIAPIISGELKKIQTNQVKNLSLSQIILIYFYPNFFK